jgi:hypothetical protein
VRKVFLVVIKVTMYGKSYGAYLKGNNCEVKLIVPSYMGTTAWPRSGTIIHGTSVRQG